MTATLATSDPVLTRFAETVGSDDPVAVVGARTRWELGGPSAEGTRLVTAPGGIVEYRPDEMTVTVRTGTTVAELHRELAAKGQRSALPDRGGTVGGALAVGQNDIRALGRSLLRTALLQIRYISADGRIISSGGPTVKNVSGFDLPRLMVGSLGTLGLLAEAIIRTNPIPAHSQWLRAEGVDPLAVYDALLAPSAVLWDGTSTWVQLEGHEADVVDQQRVLSGVGSFETVTVAGDELPVAMPPHRWSLAPSALPGLADGRLSGAAADSTDGTDPGRFVAAVGLGLAFAERPQPPRPVGPEVAAVAARLKQNFDPGGRLNPGRHPGSR